MIARKLPALLEENKGKRERTVQHSAGIYVGAELSLGVREQGQIELLFFWTEIVAFDDYRAWGKSEIVCSLDLCNTLVNSRGEGSE